MEEDILWTEKAHFATATTYTRLHLLPEREQNHRTAERRLGALRVKVRQVLTLDLHPSQPERPDAWRTQASAFAEQKATIDEDARAPPTAPFGLPAGRSRQATSSTAPPHPGDRQAAAERSRVDHLTILLAIIEI
jgi:hypothetical protein